MPRPHNDPGIKFGGTDPGEFRLRPLDSLKLPPRPAHGSLKELTADIKERGQLVPILISPKGYILDGVRRYYAIKTLKHVNIFCKVVTEDVLFARLMKHEQCLQMTVGQRLVITIGGKKLGIVWRGENRIVIREIK